MAVIMEGKRLSEEIKAKVKEKVSELKGFGINVGLAVLRIGENPASTQYYRAILRACKSVGISAFEYNLPESSSVNEILNVIKDINHDERINGLLVLFPLPRNINARRVVNEIVPEKDIDGLGSISVGRLAADESSFQILKHGKYDLLSEARFMPSVASFLPCTPFGVIRLLDYYGIDIKGKHAVVVGKSLAVGKPLSLMLLAKEATVTVCHKSTKDLSQFTRQADIICTATGVRGLIKADMVKDGAVVVDIGIIVLDDGRIVGDVEFDEVKQRASYITPVPGGVGPVTIAMLLENTLRSAQRNEFLKTPFMLE